MGRLLKPHELVALVAQRVEYWRQGAVYFNFDGVRPLSSNLAVKPGRPRADNPCETAATGGPSYS